MHKLKFNLKLNQNKMTLIKLNQSIKVKAKKKSQFHQIGKYFCKNKKMTMLKKLITLRKITKRVAHNLLL
jgi:hypothetical protein